MKDIIIIHNERLKKKFINHMVGALGRAEATANIYLTSIDCFQGLIWAITLALRTLIAR